MSLAAEWIEVGAGEEGVAVGKGLSRRALVAESFELLRVQ